ncbi:hypothetical protein KPL71_023866 [Citrus sinensis]|uniref:Uncharacterized protein n=1 Tax=Citrus sinensis TaxID=2711 RepID=A0ACB8IM28_CITSI|nr:hypothetical protein KPL71_023866 [Citrus sinensis]
MILADTDTIPTIIQIPKQIQKQELLTNYEHFHQNSEPVQTTEATFERRQNGQVKLSFQTPETKPVSNTPRLSYTTMITAVQTGQGKNLSIHGFSSEGYPVYPDKINCHFLWDVPDAHMCNPDCPCLDDTDVDEELEIMRKKKRKRSIRTLISTKRPLPKEYIQSSRLDQCALQASQSEQYVTFEIPSDLIANWKREGYTHLHLGGIRLILTLHGRKGLPVTARIALLDTRFKQYQHAVIGTVLTTFHAGSVLLTFYPNFNPSLEDPNLPTTIKVHIQLQGAEQTPTSKLATLHHQIVYRLQNHALDLPTPSTTSDALMILGYTNTIPTIIQIPKQIQKQELLKLMPLEWLTNYEHFHQISEPVQTTEATFERRQNGQVKLSFQTPEPQSVPETPRLSYIAMITAVQTGQEKSLPIHGFSSEGYPVYPDKLNGHFLWDIPEAHMCNPDIDDELEIMRRKKKKKKEPSYPKTSCKSFPPRSPPDPKPPIDTQTRVVSKPFVQSPVTASRHPEEPKQYEAILNWQTRNANAQNQTLKQLGKKIDRVASQVSQTETKIDSLSHRLDQMYIHLQDQYADITSILMANKTEDPSASTSIPIIEDNSSDDEHKASHTEPVPPMPPPAPPMPPPAHDHSTKPSSASWFTFDDIPRYRWPARLQEFAAWIDLQGTNPNAQSQAVLREFMARSTGSLRDWLESLGEYRQLQFMQSPVGTTLNIIHEQFIGEKTASTDADRKEYHQMKCCSLKRHLLESHYKRMSILFYKLNGFNDPSLKHVFIASLPSELQHDLQRKLTATNLSIADISLGKIFQMAMLCLDKICEQKDFFKDLMKDKKSFSEAYVESNFSEQSEQDDQTTFIIAESSDSEDISVISTVQNVNHESHQKLLLDFFHIVQAHGIMLSEKKNNIGKESIDFLGMIQQFLGIVNYVRDFIPKVAIHTSQLSRMLKKQCPPWGPAQTDAVKQLKASLSPHCPSVKMSFGTCAVSPPYTSSDSSELETIYESNPSESNPSSSSSSSTNSVGTSTDSEAEYADITSILMTTKTEDPSVSTATPIVEESSSDAENQTAPTEPEPSMPPSVSNHSTKPSSASWFTFDDIPRHKWPARLQEFAAWIDLQGTKPNAQPENVLREFMAHSTGSLRDWLESLGEYRQVQFMQAPIGTALNIIHEQFIGERTASKEADRKEYHQMRCCSLKRHLLESHYKRMSILFYKLNGFNEPSLKHVFIASLPTELQPDLQRQLTGINLSIAEISLGKIFQTAILCLDKICEQKEFFKYLMADKKPFSEACKNPYLQIECKDEKKFFCPTKKKKHF